MPIEMSACRADILRPRRWRTLASHLKGQDMEAIANLQGARSLNPYGAGRAFACDADAQDDLDPGGRAPPGLDRDEIAPIVYFIGSNGWASDRLAPPSRALGWRIRQFDCAQTFLDSPPLLVPSCLVLDAALPQLDVFELQQRVATDRPGMPIILMTGNGGGATTLQATPAGAVTLCAASVGDERLAEAIASALERGRMAFGRWTQTRKLRGRYTGLTLREREVMALVVCGRLNKQVGGDLGISEITVKAHRGRIMRKMQAPSLPSLVTMAARLGMATPDAW
jgi:FixJ family two-component response regulator